MGTGFSKKKKQAKALQSQLMQAQEKLQHSSFTGTAGNGLVTVTLTGDFEIKHLSIKPECVDPEDVEGLELLITAAFKDAVKQAHASSMPDLGGFGGFPGLGGF